MTDTVTLSRADYEALLARIEDAEDAAAVAVHRAREAALGIDAARVDHLPVALVDRLLALRKLGPGLAPASRDEPVATRCGGQRLSCVSERNRAWQEA
jgi:hypothetical protein